MGNLFLAIKGANVDGHDFAPQAIAAGAAGILAERPVEGVYILVPNLVNGLARYALSLRRDYSGPVVGITGSNGKTSAKEFTAAALSVRGDVIKTEGNRNSEFTSPLLWHDVSPLTSAVVVEMGMRGFNQIAHLAGFTKPTIGLITCIGTAHIEMVGSRAGIAQAKGELLQALPPGGTSILWQEDDFLNDLKVLAPGPVRTFGFDPHSDCRIVGYKALNWSSSVVRGELDGSVWEAELPVLGRHQALNAAAAVLAAATTGVDPQEAANQLRTATLPPMRMEVREWNGATLLLDNYNASPDSTVAALRALSESPSAGRKWAVLGEMKELGSFAESGHRMVGKALGESSVELALLLGEGTRYIADEALIAGYPAHQVEQTDEIDLALIRRYLAGLKVGDVLLIKGSRALGLERALEGG
ncbi:MAG: UDP-N-acetylmuramoyl-tripeptide--D-alanyl-D-alanine ligase [Fimbriimonadaceae bacterium]|jgi:UDP-N-acetylmuramoyl-tripeptide--D-alanyl-D-alanine ligase|nr:UDP-N-acetylmuramoyl-tripeptide--D-alanyl-D-alanine ligase [Fimbriimonadaceae bacterium]